MQNINVLMIDDNENLVRKVEDHFNGNAVISIKHKASNGVEALDIIKNKQSEYDLIIMDLLIPEKDGLEILENMKEAGIEKHVIVLTSYKKDYTVKMTNQYGIDYYMMKPCSMTSLEKRIMEISNEELVVEEITNNGKVQIQMAISKLLHSLGVPSHIKGYQYIRESIYMMYTAKDIIGGITKEIYPEIADRFDTTASRVERAIRHAIEVSWSRGDYDLMEEIFGHSVDYDRAKPTNSEFIATLADRLKLDRQLVYA